MPARRYSTARERQARQTRWGVALLVVLALVVSVVGAALFYLSPEHLSVDHCPDSGPKGLAAILIDSTDQLSASQLLDVRNRLVIRIQNLPTGTGVQLWRVTPGGTGVPEPVGPLVCRPEREPNWLYQNARSLRARYAAFEKEALAQVDGGLNASTEPQSPILEAIQAVSLRTFQAPQFGRVSNRELVIVSDLQQNTSELSMVRSVPRYEDFRQSPAYARLRTDLTGVNVHILFLSRDTVGIRDSIRFWQALIADFGGTLSEVDRIVG